MDFVDWNQSDQCNKGNFLKILSGRDPIMRLTANTVTTTLTSITSNNINVYIRISILKKL